MKCIHCQGTMKKGTAPFDIDRRDYHLRLEKIPAWVCSQCGEVYFEENEVDTMQKVLHSIDEQTEKMRETA